MRCTKFSWILRYKKGHLISVRRPDLVTVKKKKKTTNRIVDFDVPADHGVKLKDSEKRDKYLYLARELRKLWNMNVMVIPIAVGALGTIPKETGRLTNPSTSRDNPECSITKIGQKTEKSPGDLRRLVTQTTVKDHQLTLVWKNSQSGKIIMIKIIKLWIKRKLNYYSLETKTRKKSR